MAEALKRRIIYVAGAARGGTTLLVNLLGRLRGVSVVTHELHWGNKELPVEQIRRRFGDITDPEEFLKFIDLFSGSDFFAATGVQKADIENAQPRSVYSVFFATVNAVCEKEQTAVFATKLDPELLFSSSHMAQYFEACLYAGFEPTIVFIDRGMADVLRSYLNMEGEKSVWRRRWITQRAGLILHVARLALMDRFRRAIPRSMPHCFASYDKLVREPAVVGLELCRFLGLEFEPGDWVPQDIQRNSSPSRARSPLGRIEIKMLVPIRRFFGTAAGARLARFLLRWRAIQVRPWPFSYRLRLADRYPEYLAERFRASGQLELLRVLQERTKRGARYGTDQRHES